jgi:chemotaxis protein CheX
MNFQEQDIRDITETVWTNVLSVSAEASEDDPLRSLAGRVYTGCVQISGAWEGAVTLRCSLHLARTVAATMYELGPVEPSTDEVRDALGELTNMVGGNIKALLPGPTHLSLPVVAEGDRQSLRISDSEPVCTVWFASHGEAFAVTVLSRAEGPSSQPKHLRNGGSV